MNQDETLGVAKKLSGRATEAAGILTGDDALERKGAAQRVEGAIQEGFGKATRKVDELVDDAVDAIKK